MFCEPTVNGQRSPKNTEQAAAGFFEKIWTKGLEQYDELEGIGWGWQSVDCSMVRAPLALEAVGHNPTDRGKNGDKTKLLVDEKGLPLSVALDGANRRDVKLLETTLEHIVIARPEATPESPQHLCMDAGYTGSAQTVEARGYTAHIRPRGEERKAKQTNLDFQAYRWVVEVNPLLFQPLSQAPGPF